jgi:pimeloyl-ACP methyl ester carboxylesterase
MLKDSIGSTARDKIVSPPFCISVAHMTIMSIRLTRYTDIDETHAALEGEESLTKFTMAQRTDMLKADVKGMTEVMASILPEVDKRALLDSDEMGEYLVKSIHASVEHNTDGWVDDGLAFVKPWGFDISETKCPVFLYHGSEDLMVPYAHGKWIAEKVPEKLLVQHLSDGEGHISIFLGRAEAMIDELMSVPRS